MVKSTEQVMAEIEAAIGARPRYDLTMPDYHSILNNHRGIDLGAPTDFSKYAVSGHGTGKKKKKSGLKPDFWGMISGTLGQPVGLLTDSLYEQIGNVKNWNKDPKRSTADKLFEIMVKDNPLAQLVEGVGAGAKEQLKDWKDGETSWGDFPAIGFLHGMDKNWKRGTDITKDHLDMEGGWGTGVGIGIDIALDPLTYLTGGLSTATKLRKVAEAVEIAKTAKAYGLTGKFKNTDELADELIPALQKKYEKYPYLADRMVERKFNQITNDIKAASSKAFNDNINKMSLSVPFSNKMTAPVMNIKNKGLGKALYRSEAKAPSSLVQGIINDATQGNSALTDILTRKIQSRYGVANIADLTKTQYDDLANHLEEVIAKGQKAKSLPDVKTTQSVVENAMPQADFDRLMTAFVDQNMPWKDVQKQLDGFMSVIGTDSKLRSTVGADFADKISKFWAKKAMRKNSAAHNALKSESMAWASKFLKDSDTYKTVKTTVDEVHPTGSPQQLADKNAQEIYKLVGKEADPTKAGKGGFKGTLDTPYSELNNAKTGFERWLNKRNPFDSRTLKTGDEFLDSMADHISDANSRRVGETAMYTKGMEAVQKFVNKHNNSEDLMRNAIYHLEGKVPDSYPKNWKPSSDEEKLANLIKPLLNSIGADDMEAGTLSHMVDKYFPHVANKGTKDVDDMIDFDARHPDLGDLSSANKFDKSRKSFKTIADQDNYVAKLAKKISKETDPDVKASLQKQLERVENFFETDVVKALTRRIGEGVRSRAMKEMQGKLSRFGMMDSVNLGEETKKAGLKLLDPEEARKLGLPKGQKHYMHPKVLDGLKKTDEIFTDEGMNKFVRHLSAVSDIWRPLVTYYKPAHYVNNAIGNTFQNLAAGVTISDYNAARKLYTKYKKGKQLTKSEEKLIKLAYRHNVISGGFLFDSKANYEFLQSTRLEKVAKAVGDNKGIKKIRAFGEVVDDFSRLTNFMNGMKKYGNAEKAAQQTREYLFNYNELTKADKAMRAVVPFWNWTKRNIPLQMKLLMEQPKYAVNTERFRDFFNEGKEGEDWQKDTGINLEWMGLDRYTNIPAPVNDLTLIENPASFLGSLNPALKMPAEMGLNKKFYQNQAISYGADEIQPEDFGRYIASNTGVGNDVYKMASGENSMLEFLAGLFKSTSKINPIGGE